jgi:hypothetical protein
MLSNTGQVLIEFLFEEGFPNPSDTIGTACNKPAGISLCLNNRWIFPMPENLTVVLGVCGTFGIETEHAGVRAQGQFLF